MTHDTGGASVPEHRLLRCVFEARCTFIAFIELAYDVEGLRGGDPDFGDAGCFFPGEGGGFVHEHVSGDCDVSV